MPKKAIMFGSIGTMAETSDIQRRSYNQALNEAGLDWEWDRETYSALLEQAGGKERLSMLAAATGRDLNEEQIEKIHARKTELACQTMKEEGTGLRLGVAELVNSAKDRGMKLALVTTTYQPNIDAVFAAAGDAFDVADFDYIVAREDVSEGKPSPEPYELALKKLGLDAADVLAIEDTATSVMSAKRAGIETIAVPGALSSGQDFWQADEVLDDLNGDDGLHDRLTSRLG